MVQINSLAFSYKTKHLFTIHPYNSFLCICIRKMRDLPGSPLVKTSPSNAGGVGSIPDQGSKIPHASQPKNQNIKQKQWCNKFNKDFKKSKHILKKKKTENIYPQNRICT